MAFESYLNGGHLYAKYTMTFKSILDNNFDIGLQNYPIFNEDYRPILNQKIIDHFIGYEIAHETPGRFIQRLNTVMNEIMPLYNQYYKAEMYEFDPLTNYKSKETLDRDIEENTDRNDVTVGEDNTLGNDITTGEDLTTTTANNETSTHTVQNDDATAEEVTQELTRRNDTAETQITIEDLNTGAWATEVVQNNRTNNATSHNDNDIIGESTSDDTANGQFDTERDFYTSRDFNTARNFDQNIGKLTDEFYTRLTEGYRGVSPADLINKLYSSFVNIDLMILEDVKLNKLFFGLLNVSALPPNRRRC